MENPMVDIIDLTRLANATHNKLAEDIQYCLDRNLAVSFKDLERALTTRDKLRRVTEILDTINSLWYIERKKVSDEAINKRD